MINIRSVMRILRRSPYWSLYGTMLMTMTILPAGANDSTAQLVSGGLQLVPNYAIQMRSERLEISRERIDIEYRFVNMTDTSVRTLVAFPLPPVMIGEDVGYSIEPTDPVNFVDFRVTADGVPVTPNVEMKAIVNGVDFSEILKSEGAFLAPFATDYLDRLNALPLEAKARLADTGALDLIGDTNEVIPNWSMNVTFYWMQEFPANREVKITHIYNPGPAAFIFAGEDTPDELRDQFCMTDGFIRTVEKRMGKSSENVLIGYDLRYILKTANN
ncbi:MAG: DUF4424 domain-containing protein, partial [Fimbriimonadaceae bacterium]|nr:DUF4424 domain-containing protein [Alphaproteobacteria bacterium]